MLVALVGTDAHYNNKKRKLRPIIEADHKNISTGSIKEPEAFDNDLSRNIIN